jgi:Tfp pilus assembly protein PilF
MIASLILAVVLFTTGCGGNEPINPTENATAAATPLAPPTLPAPGEMTPTPSPNPSARPLPPSPTPDAAVQAAAQATLQASSFLETITKLKDEGKITTTEGEYHHLDDVDQSAALRGEYFWIPTEYSPPNFVLRADVAWQSADANADWSVSGPGFLFHESDDNRFYAIFLRLNGQVDLYRIDVDSNIFFYVANKKIEKIGKPDGKAALMLVVEEDAVHFYVDDQLVISTKDANLVSPNYASGRLNLAIASGTNKDFGTRVIFSNIELWELGTAEQPPATSPVMPSSTAPSPAEDTLTQEGIQAFQSGDFENALTLLNKAIASDPNYKNPDGYITRGRAYYALKQYSRAITDFNQAIRFAPAGSKIYLYRGYAYEKIKNYSKALSDYNTTIQLDANDVWAFRSRAMLYITQKKYIEALKDLDQAITLEPDSASTINNRCWLKYLLKQYSEALVDCDKALRIEPDHPSYLESRAFVYKALDQTDKARADFERILTLSDDKALTTRIQAEVKKLKSP